MYFEEDQVLTLDGLYVAAFFDFVTNVSLADYCARHAIPSPTAESSLHSTIVYSRLPVDFAPLHEVDAHATPLRLECWDTQSGKTLVLVLESAYLQTRFDYAKSKGATFDYDEYTPHITLSYDIGDYDWTKLPVPNFTINIIGEYSEPLSSSV